MVGVSELVFAYGARPKEGHDGHQQEQEGPAKEPAPKKATATKAQLTKAAKMRDEDASREATKTKLGSSAWFRAWERDGIAHRPAGESKPKTPAAGS